MSSGQLVIVQDETRLKLVLSPNLETHLMFIIIYNMFIATGTPVDSIGSLNHVYNVTYAKLFAQCSDLVHRARTKWYNPKNSNNFRIMQVAMQFFTLFPGPSVDAEMNVHKPRSESELSKKNVDRRFVPEVYYVDDDDDHDRGMGQKSTGDEEDDADTEDDDDDDGVEDNLFDDFGASASEEDEANDSENSEEEEEEALPPPPPSKGKTNKRVPLKRRLQEVEEATNTNIKGGGKKSKVVSAPAKKAKPVSVLTSRNRETRGGGRK